MVKKIFRFIKSPTTLAVTINTFGNYLNIFFTAFFAILLVRVMNPVDYGTLSVLLGIAYVLANILDFGVSASIYSYLPELLENKSDRLFSFLKATFFYQFSFASVVVFILIIFFPFLDKIFFKTYAPWWELYLTIFSVVFLIWQNYALNTLLAARKVFKANLFLNLSNILKAGFVFILIALNKINVATILFTFGIVGPALFFFFLFFEKKTIIVKIIKAKIDKKDFKLSYTLTYFIASQFFNLGTRMDLFLLSYYFPKNEIIGYYGLSTKIILTLFAAITSITQILSPHFAKVKYKAELALLTKKSFFYLLFPSGLFLMLFLTPKIVFQIAFTEKFLNAVSITHMLSLAYLFYPLFNIPLLFFLYTLKQPKHILIANLIFFILISLLCFFLIPKFGVYAGPIAVFVSLMISGGYLTLVFINKIKSLSNTL